MDEERTILDFHLSREANNSRSQYFFPYGRNLAFEQGGLCLCATEEVSEKRAYGFCFVDSHD